MTMTKSNSRNVEKVTEHFRVTQMSSSPQNSYPRNCHRIVISICIPLLSTKTFIKSVTSIRRVLRIVINFFLIQKKSSEIRIVVEKLKSRCIFRGGASFLLFFFFIVQIRDTKRLFSSTTRNYRCINNMYIYFSRAGHRRKFLRHRG